MSDSSTNGVVRLLSLVRSSTQLVLSVLNSAWRALQDTNRLSLTSSRPAPPSPAVSRRQSRTPSRPVSSDARPSVCSTDPATPTSSAPTTSTAFILIRDYGFASSDPRHTGQGPNVPRANRPTLLARRLTVSGDGDEDEDEDEDGLSDHKAWSDVDEQGWRGFKWGGFGRAWGFGSGGFPTRGDLDRNFGGEDHEMEDDELSEEPIEDVPLSAGIYRAMYPFEPEGTVEMKLDEDQLVRVVGRGGGVGWAVVVKDGLKDNGVHALVPESYLEVVRLDGEDEDVEC